MSTPVRASDRDLRALAAIVSQDRPDLPDGEGLPPSLLADLKDQIRCDEISLDRYDSGRPRVSESGGGAAAGPGLHVDLIVAVLAWPDGGKSGFEELAAQPGEHVGG